MSHEYMLTIAMKNVIAKKNEQTEETTLKDIQYQSKESQEAGNVALTRICKETIERNNK